MQIKNLPKVDRPREKLMKYGPDRLSNSELLAILIRTGRKGENVLEIAGSILKKFGGSKLPEVSFDELKQIFGLGPVKSCEIIACFELGKRLLKGKKAVLILSPRDVWIAMKDISALKKEHFAVFYLDSRSQSIQREIVSVGALNTSLIHPREVFEPAVIRSAAQVVIAHNHPSGDIEPSGDDFLITNRLKLAGEILGIEIVDHLIVAKNSFFSFKEKGLLEN